MHRKNKTQDECQKLFHEKAMQMRADIAEINDDTPWSEVEPKWWLAMMEIDAALVKYFSKGF